MLYYDTGFERAGARCIGGVEKTFLGLKTFLLYLADICNLKPEECFKYRK